MAVADGRPEPDLEIRALEVDDVVFVRDSWRESYKTAPQRRTMSWPAYKATYGRAIDRLLEREDVLILGAYSADGRVKGWIAWTPGGVPTVHYVYVRDALRRLGVAGRLIRAAELGRRMVYSLRGKLPRKGESLDLHLVASLARRGVSAAYVPLRVFLRNESTTLPEDE